MKLRVVSKSVVRDGEAFNDMGERLDIHCEHHRPKDGPLGNADRSTVGSDSRSLTETVWLRGLRNCRPAREPVLNVRHRQARLQWAQGHLNWNNVRWQNVLFSDESRFCIDHTDGRVRVLGPVIFQGLGPGRGNGITVQRYMDQVLHPHVLPFFQAHGNWVFQHDNARPHTARATQDLLQRSGIQVMPWPALSPDMNPI
nr:hypothetical protein BaRGS_028956 [Batillaria attramentaria]